MKIKVFLGLIVIISAALAGAWAQEGSGTPRKEMFVFIRVDDIFMRKSDLRPQEIDAFLSIAEKHGARVILATIPMRLVQKTNINGMMTEQIRDYARRGHQIAQHGYNHQCPFTGRSDHDLYTPDIEGYTTEQRLDKIREGRNILEAVLGKRVVTYVAPGGDGKYMGDDVNELYKMGYVAIPKRDASSADSQTSHGLCVSARDYTWALTEEKYGEMMEEAKKSFLEAAESRAEWSILFHDHFTRRAYNNGITLRWFDEFLTWLDTLPDIKVRYSTFEEYYAMRQPEFSNEFR